MSLESSLEDNERCSLCECAGDGDYRLQINYSIPTLNGVTSVFTIKRYHYHLLSPAFNGAITGPSVLTVCHQIG